jgi:hypothetical protein
MLGESDTFVEPDTCVSPTYIPYQCAYIVRPLLEMHVYIAQSEKSGTCSKWKVIVRGTLRKIINYIPYWNIDEKLETWYREKSWPEPNLFHYMYNINTLPDILVQFIDIDVYKNGPQ